MNRKLFRKVLIGFILTFGIIFINIDFVSAKCSEYQGNSSKCKNATESGYKCKYNSSKKGAATSTTTASTTTSTTTKAETSSTTTTANNNSTTTSTKAKKCSNWASKGKKVCTSNSYNGYKCAWNGNKKGGGRCYQSNSPTKEKRENMVENLNSCSEIKKSNVCSNSRVKGKECIWRQGACYSASDNGTGETIIASSREDREKQEKNPDISADDIVGFDKKVTEAKNGKKTCGLVADDTMDFLKNFFFLIQVFGVILLVVMSMIEFIKALTASDDEGLKGAIKNTFRRIIVVIILLLLPMLIIWVIGMINDNAYATDNQGKRIIGDNNQPLCKW